jgi:hypothetical protein
MCFNSSSDLRDMRQRFSLHRSYKLLINTSFLAKFRIAFPLKVLLSPGSPVTALLTALWSLL